MPQTQHPPSSVDGRKRQTHKKSRLGCRNCKLRRVKVSLNHPSLDMWNTHKITISVMKPNLVVLNVKISECCVISTAQFRIFSPTRHAAKQLYIQPTLSTDLHLKPQILHFHGHSVPRLYQRMVLLLSNLIENVSTV
jgi:hypothetical protein